jgi:hypothetical protein
MEEAKTTQLIQQVAVSVSNSLSGIPGLNLVFIIVVGWLLFRLIKWTKRS